MRSTSICWSCAVAIAVGCIGGSYASMPDNYYGPGESNSDLGSADGAQKVVEGQRIVGSVPTSTTPAVISYPKITEGPSLGKRKLGSNHWDLIHDGIQGQKRDATACPTDYILCPQSLNGGCCPSDRVCGSSSCYPASATASACGYSDYFACGPEAGGGCCPMSYICATDSCSPSPGVSYSQTCGVGSRLCPSSVGYGCCPTNLGCAVNSCYETTPSTFTVTETLTTTIDSFPTTITTTITSVTVLGEPTGSSTTDGSVAKITPPAAPIAKTAATGSSNGGLSKPELGGIIGGAIFVLIVVLVATFLIIKRLNKVEKVAQASRTSSSGPRSGRSGQRPSINPDVDAMSQDPFLMSPSEVSGSIRRGSKQSSGLHSSTHEVEANEASSPPIFNSPFSPRSPPNTHYPRGYAPVASSESQYSQSSGGYRNHSVDSTPPLQHNPNAGYFDLPLQSDHRVSVSTVAGRRPSQHGRNWSNASDQSAVSQNSQNSTPTPVAELDAGRDGDRRSSLQWALQGFGMGRIMSRRRSDPVVLTGGPTRQQERPVNQGLGHIPEAGESRLHLDAGVGRPQMTEISLIDQPSSFTAQAGPGYDQKTNDYRNDIVPGR